MAAELLRELTAHGVRLWVADCGGPGFDGPLALSKQHDGG